MPTLFRPKKPGQCLWSKTEFRNLSIEDRVIVFLSDGQWWSLEKLLRMLEIGKIPGKVPRAQAERDVAAVLRRLTENKTIVRAKTGAKSYRMPLESVLTWYRRNGVDLGQRLVASNFPVRIFGGVTEIEGFLNAPLRECTSISFKDYSSEVFYAVRQAMAGVGTVRRGKAGRVYVKTLAVEPARTILRQTLDRFPESHKGRLSISKVAARRLVDDLDPRFFSEMMEFYLMFIRSRLKKQMEIITVFLPLEEEQTAQLTEWVIEAVEKYDEMASVPLSGYLENSVPYWAHDLPQQFIGKELAEFQNKRSKAVKALRKARQVPASHEFSYHEIAEQMGIPYEHFMVLKEQNDTWFKQRNMESITRGEDTSEERRADTVFSLDSAPSRDYQAATDVFFAALSAADDTVSLNDLYYFAKIASDDSQADVSVLSQDFLERFAVRYEERKSG